MPPISAEKRQKIKEAIVALLYHNMPKPMFTAEIARELARDEEFVKQLLLELQKQNIVRCITKNEKGKTYVRRQRWQLTLKAYEAYSKLAV